MEISISKALYTYEELHSQLLHSRKLGTEPNRPTNGDRIYSKNMADSCLHRCRTCLKEVTLTGMRIHVRNCSGMSITEYTEKFGNYKTQISREVWHKCSICGEDFLLDGDEIHKHAKKHRMMMAEYTSKYIQSADKKIVKEEVHYKRTEALVDRGPMETIKNIEHILEFLVRC